MTPYRKVGSHSGGRHDTIRNETQLPCEGLGTSMKLLHRYITRLLAALCGLALLMAWLQHLTRQPLWPPSTLFAAAPSPQVLDRMMQRALPYAQVFQKVTLQSTRDITVRGYRAVDLYWKSVNLASQPGSRAERIARGINDLYSHLQGSHVAEVAITPCGWKTEAPGKALVLTQGKLESKLLIVLSNHTATPQTFTVASANPVLEVLAKTLALPVGVSRGIFVKTLVEKPGRVTAPLRVRSAQSETTVPLEFDVHPAGPLIVNVMDRSGHTVPARVFLVGSDGFSHTPEGSVDRVMWMSVQHFFYTGGMMRAKLPAGNTKIEVLKGFDYLPTKAEVKIEPGKTMRLVLRLKYLQDMNSQGWYSGADNIHTNYIGDTMRPRDLLLIAQAEGLNVANVGICYSTGPRVYDEKYFEGRPNAVSTRKCILYWNAEMRTDGPCGHLIFLNLKQLVRPIYTGFVHTPSWENYPSNYAQARKAQQQRGFVAYAQPALGYDKFEWGPEAGESPVDVALDAVEGFEVFCSHDAPSMDLWYKFLNLGFKLGITGGSDALFNRTFTFVVGGERVHVYTGRRFDYSKWIEGLKQERSFATRGPLLFFKLRGNLPGHKFYFSDGPQKLQPAARAFSYIPMTKLEIVVNGKVMDRVVQSTPTDHLEWKGTLTFNYSAWVAARIWGPNNCLIANGPSRWAESHYHAVLLAHTSPSHVEIAGSKIYSERDRDFVLRWIDALIAKLNATGKFGSQIHRQEVVDVCLRAHPIYEQMAP